MSSLVFIIGVILVSGLAFANGSNDVSKGIATLVGSGVTSYRRAILWGTVWTVLGTTLAIFVSQAMVQVIANGIISNPSQIMGHSAVAPFSIIIGAMIWVLFATKTGLPVSTTHAIVGALCGVGLAAMGLNGIQWISLTQKAFIPLLISPLVAIGLSFFLFPMIRSGLSGWKGHCLCFLPMGKARVIAGQTGFLRVIPTDPEVVGVVDSPECDLPRSLALRIGPDTLHWLTSGLTSFARGLNDGPKIAALLIGATFFSGDNSMNLASWTFGVVGISMGLGGLFAGRRVTEVLAEKVTRMDHLEGFSANLTTAFLVIVAARFGLPVSTTHVSSGAILGMGLRKGIGQLNLKMVGEIALAWLLTLPIAGLLSSGCYLLLKMVSVLKLTY